MNEVIPNAAERILTQFEKETGNRHERERRAQLYPFLDQLAARATAFFFAMGCLAVAGYAIEKSQPWVAGAFGAATVAIGVNAFLRRSDVETASGKQSGKKKSR